MSTHDDEYRTTQGQAGSSMFDDSGFTSGAGQPGSSSEQTTLLSGVTEDSDERADDANRWHAGLDLGLLVLRVVVGAIMTAHGAQKLFGVFDGPGMGAFADGLGAMGYTTQTTLLAWITALSEFGGGLLLILGLFTPIGAAAILGVMANIVYVKWTSGAGWSLANQGFEYELTLGAAALALLFTGAGRVALDKNTPWRRKPMPFALLGLLVAAAASVLVIVLAR